MFRRRWLLLILPVLGAWIAALHGSPGHGAPTATDSFFQTYWKLPVPPQGSPPPEFHPLAASLNPQNCAACHPRQFADWVTSLHSHAMGPGVTGQLVDFLKRKPEDAASCENCHAPLSEQHEWLTDANGHGRANARFAPELRAAAVSCAACHVRGFHRNGPPRNPQHPSGIAWTGLPAKPHGEVFRTPHFEQSQFCAPCHQFGPGNDVNGKPLENTLEEWRRSVYARQGVSCQVCHMPERRHLWRGIHDPAMVRRGVSIAFQGPVQSGSALTATLTVSNTRVGHDFPTYITPQVLVRMEQQDQLGRSIPGTRREWRIGRTIDFTSAGVEELSDTRIPPGESRSFSYRGRIQSTATRLRAWIQVYPDHYYTGFYHQVLAQRDRSSNSKRQLLEALTHSQRTSYLLFDRRVELGR